MSKINRTCKVCKKGFYACNDCQKFGSWRLRFCSVECYQKYILETGFLEDASNNNSIIGKKS